MTTCARARGVLFILLFLMSMLIEIIGASLSCPSGIPFAQVAQSSSLAGRQMIEQTLYAPKGAAPVGRPVTLALIHSNIPTDTFFWNCIAVKRELHAFALNVNDDGGFLMGGVRHPLYIIYLGDDSTAEGAANATAFAVDCMGADVILGPFSSAMTYSAIHEASSRDKLLISGTVQSKSVIGSSALAFSSMQPSVGAASRILKHIRRTARDIDAGLVPPFVERCGPSGPSCVDGLKVGALFDEDDVYSDACGLLRSGEASAMEMRMAGMPDGSPLIFPFKGAQDEQGITDGLMTLQDANVTVVVVCDVDLASTIAVIRALNKSNYSPHAIISLSMPAEYASRVSVDTQWLGEYLLFEDYGTYYEELDSFKLPAGIQGILPTGNSSNEDSRFRKFIAGYMAANGGAPASNSISTHVALNVLRRAIEATGRLEGSVLAHEIRNNHLHDGPFSFQSDADGLNMNASVSVIQCYDRTRISNPDFRGSGSSCQEVKARGLGVPTLAFPMPTWEYRRCQRKYARECSGRGKCDQSGMCVCEGGWTGPSCSNPPMDLTSDNELIVLVACVASGVMLMLLLAWLLHSRWQLQRQQARLARLRSTGLPPKFPASKNVRWHLFLSHVCESYCFDSDLANALHSCHAQC